MERLSLAVAQRELVAANQRLPKHFLRRESRSIALSFSAPGGQPMAFVQLNVRAAMNASPITKKGGLLTGKCLCGSVEYTVQDEFTYALNCHCSNCRRATGSAFKPFGGIERHKLSVTRGGERLHIFGQDLAHDAHCKSCGSLLYSVVRDGAFVHVTLGTLVDGPSIRPTAHIFVGSKAPWFTITDDLPQHEAFG